MTCMPQKICLKIFVVTWMMDRSYKKEKSLRKKTLRIGLHCAWPSFKTCQPSYRVERPDKIVIQIFYLNPHPHMRGPCGPRKTLLGAPAAFFGTPEPTVYLIVHNTIPLSQTTLIFPSSTVMALKPWHDALSALGSVRTPQSISCDSIIMEGWLEFPNPQTLWALLQSVHENISW